MEFKNQLIEEAEKLAQQGFVTILQNKLYKTNAKGKLVKDLRGLYKYATITNPLIALKRLKEYLKYNEANTLGILLHNVVNLDFDNMDEYYKFIELGLIEPYNSAVTRVNKTPKGVHYLFQTPKNWSDNFNKTTHIDGSDVDVLFGPKNIVEHVYPSFSKHPEKGKLTYQKINENPIAMMSDKLRAYLEPKLTKKNYHLNLNHGGDSGQLEGGKLSIPQEAPTELIKKLVVQLSTFGYKDPAFVREGKDGFDFTYDHSIPDPLDPAVTHDHIDGYVYINEDDNYAVVGTYSDKCKRKDAFLCYLEEPDFETFDSEPPSDVAKITYSERYVRPFLDVHPVSGKQHKASAIQSDMGTGKSEQVKNYIHRNDPQSILILTPRISFGLSFQNKLNSSLPATKQFKIYNDEKTERYFEDDRMICQMESIHRISKEKYGLIVIDEIESCLASFSSSTMARKRKECVEIFAELLKNADKLIFCDAHISERTFGLLRDMGIPNSEIVIEHNTFQPNQRIAYKVPFNPKSKNLPPLLELFIEKIKEGKKIVFCTSSKKMVLKIQELVVSLKLLDRSECEFYHAGSENKNQLINVEKEWSSKRLVVWNTTISVGIDFNIPYFDLLFVHAINYGCGPVRDIFQSMHRVRQLKDNTLYYSLSTSSEIQDPITSSAMAKAKLREWRVLSDAQNPSIGADTPSWLVNLHIINLVESGTSKRQYEKVFDHYLEICGYKKQITSLNCLGNLDDIEVADVIPDYDQIKEIDPYEAPQLRQRVFYSSACTSSDKLELLKFEYHDVGYRGKTAFPMWCTKPGRDYLMNFAREQTESVDSLFRQQKDYAMFIETDALRLQTIQKVTKILNLLHSTDTNTEFCASQIIDNVDELTKACDALRIVNQKKAQRESSKKHNKSLEHQAEYVEVKNDISHAFQAYTGCTVANATTKTGKGAKTKKVGGKQLPVYNLIGINLNDHFLQPSFNKELLDIEV